MFMAVGLLGYESKAQPEYWADLLLLLFFLFFITSSIASSNCYSIQKSQNQTKSKNNPECK